MVSDYTATQIASLLWDLRDDAYDHPEQWEGVSAVACWQGVASLLEGIADGTHHGTPREFVRLVRAKARQEQGLG